MTKDVITFTEKMPDGAALLTIPYASSLNLEIPGRFFIWRYEPRSARRSDPRVPEHRLNRLDDVFGSRSLALPHRAESRRRGHRPPPLAVR